jgi:uridine kinase
LGRVIAVAGAVGAGKSALVSALGSMLSGTTSIHFDHYEQMTRQPIDDVRRWMDAGADIDTLPVPGLGEALEALKQGYAVMDPATNAQILPAQHILFETQFGRAHSQSGRHVDFLAWIDTPLDIALARKVRQFARELDSRDPAEAAAFGAWLSAYLDNYLGVVGQLLRFQREKVAAQADIVVDGLLAPEAQAREIARAVAARFA